MALDLGKQVGPLPIGAWVAVVGGGLGIGWYFSKGTAKSNAAATQAPLTDPGVGTGGGQFVYDPPTAVTNPTNNTITDNASWSIKAINWLIGRHFDPSLAQSAITKFLNGTNRTLTEQSLINLALIEFGTPPEGVPLPDTPVTTPPIGIPKPVRPPRPIKAFTFHTVQKGETTGSISKRYGTSWWNIYVANDKVGLRPDGSNGVMNGPWDTRAGMVLVIPTGASGGLRKPPAARNAPIRYYTAVTGDTVTAVGKKFGVHPAVIFQANDIAGPRPDGSMGFLTNPSQRIPAGKRLVIPYQ